MGFFDYLPNWPGWTPSVYYLTPGRFASTSDPKVIREQIAKMSGIGGSLVIPIGQKELEKLKSGLKPTKTNQYVNLRPGDRKIKETLGRLTPRRAATKLEWSRLHTELHRERHRRSGFSTVMQQLQNTVSPFGGKRLLVDIGLGAKMWCMLEDLPVYLRNLTVDQALEKLAVDPKALATLYDRMS